MADKPEGGGGFGPFFLLIFVIIVLFIFSGGASSTPSNNNAQNSTSTNPASKRTDVWSKTDASTDKLIDPRSPLFGAIKLMGNNLYATSVDYEYIELETSNLSKKTLISGFEIRSSITGRGAIIGGATNRPSYTRARVEEPVYINPGDKVYLITGPSPIGFSFRGNKCTGYFNQFGGNLTPYLPNECPLASTYSYPPVPPMYKNRCYEYIDSLGSCNLPRHPSLLVDEIGPECLSYVETFGYDQCVAFHQNDPDFYKPFWYIYLNLSQELWDSSHEFIRLLDTNKKTVNYIDYR